MRMVETVFLLNYDNEKISHQSNFSSTVQFSQSNNNTRSEAKFLPTSQQMSSLSLGTSPTVTRFGAVYCSDSLGCDTVDMLRSPKG